MLSPKRQCAISVGSQIPNNHQQIKFANSGIVAATAVALSNKISTHQPHPSAILNPVAATTAVAHFAPHNLFVQRQQHQINATATTQHYQQYTTQPFITATTVNPTSNIQLSNEEATNNLTTITSSNQISSKVNLINSTTGSLTPDQHHTGIAVAVNTPDTTKMDNQMTLAPLGLSQSMDSVNTASNEEEVSCAKINILFFYL